MRYKLFAISVLALLCSCTLYLEDDERALRTDEGYLAPVTIDLPDDAGTVEYQYNQKTIAITDEVEQYVVRVESDTIVYFVDGTPELLLPEVGEMMTCSFREKFPNAFCHRCVERTQHDGLYRCVFTPCSVFEAFDKFKATCNQPEYTDVPGTIPVSDEEMDSLMSTIDGGDAGPAATRASVKKDKTKKVKIECPRLELQGVGGLSDYVYADVKASVDPEMTLGYSYNIEYDEEGESFSFSVGIYGMYHLNFHIEASGGCTFKTPISIPILGGKVDFIVVGVNLGLSCTPYLNVLERVYCDADLTTGIDLEVTYTQNANNKNGTFTINKGDAGKVGGKPVFVFNPTLKGEAVLHIEPGLDFQVGMGVKVVGDIELAGGVKVFQQLEQDLLLDKFQSAEDFRNKNANFPCYVQAYMTGHLGCFCLAANVNYTSEAVKIGTPKIPLFPVFEKGSIYCTDKKPPYRFKMYSSIKEKGLMNYLLDDEPKMKIYNQAGQEVERFNLKLDKDKCHFKAEVVSDKILFNIPYIAQLAYTTNIGVSFPVGNIAFEIQVPDMTILSMDATYTNHGEFWKEVPGDTENPMPHDKLFRYCYTVDVLVNIEATRLIRKWGLHMNDIYANSTDFSMTNKETEAMALPVVRFRWYSNVSWVYLSCYPYCFVEKEQKAIKFSSKSTTVKYDPSKEYASGDEQTPDYDAELDNGRSRSTTSAQGHYDSNTDTYCEVVGLLQ